MILQHTEHVRRLRYPRASLIVSSGFNRLVLFCLYCVVCNSLVAGTLEGPAEPSINSPMEAQQTWRANEIQAALLEHPQLRHFDILADVEGNNVRLRGEVSSEDQRSLAERIAADFDGVQAVENQIRVTDIQVHDDNAVEDSVISARISVKIMANESLSLQEIAVTSEHGVVTLSGTVDSEQEEILAVSIARSVANVKSVSNHLSVVQ